MDDAALRAAAPVLDAKLRTCAHRTIVHGDAKLANFCFAEGAVAAVDFQYAGGGAGVKDVAYFLGSCSRRGAEIFESRYLDAYFARLRAELRARGTDVDPGAVEAEWRALYPIAGADFFRFLAGWAPAEWRRDDVGQRLVRDVLRALG